MSKPRPLLPGRKPLPDDIAEDWRKTDARSRLAAARRHRGISQQDMAGYIGVSIATYRRLENKEIANPGLRYLVNCALVLEIELTALIEDEWLEWADLTDRTPPSPPELPWITRFGWPKQPPAP